MQLSETTLKSALCAHLRAVLPRSVVMQHEELIKIRAGDPDISVSWNWCTSWVEAKFADPKIRTKHRIQTLRMMELAATTSAFYVVWYKGKDGDERTYILPPLAIHQKTWDPATNRHFYRPGFDHDYVAQYIRDEHTRRLK